MLGNESQSTPHVYTPDYTETLDALGLPNTAGENDLRSSEPSGANEVAASPAPVAASTNTEPSLLFQTPNYFPSMSPDQRRSTRDPDVPYVVRNNLGAMDTSSNGTDVAPIPDPRTSLLGDGARVQPERTPTVTSIEVEPNTLFKVPGWRVGIGDEALSMDGQESVTDQQILAAFPTDEDEEAFFDLLVREYENILIAEDVAGLARFENEPAFFHLRGRFVAHFDRDGDGAALLRELRRDIERHAARAGNDRVRRIRSAYSLFRYRLSGKKELKGLVTDYYIPAGAKAPGVRGRVARFSFRRKNRKSRSGGKGKGSDVKIYRWSDTPPGVTRLSPGSIRVFTGQSKKTMKSMLEKGLQVMDPKKPGRATRGRGVYTSQQRAVAEKYKRDHGKEGVIAQATPNVTGLKALNVAHGPGKKAFAKYLDSVPGLRSAWNKADRNKGLIFETFINSYAPDADIVVAPHGAGGQIVFRSATALARLNLSLMP